jgi:signal transduction histidine kinase
MEHGALLVIDAMRRVSARTHDMSGTATGVPSATGYEGGVDSRRNGSVSCPQFFFATLDCKRYNFAQSREDPPMDDKKKTTAQSERWFGALVRVMDVGVVFLTVGHELEFANTSAYALLGYADSEDLQRHWSEFRRLLEPGLDCKRADGTPGLPLDVEVTAQGRTRKLRLELYRLEEDNCDGVLILVKDREMLEALEDELALAIQMRALTRFQTEAVHDLRAPLNAMVLNLELLKDALPPDEDAERQARQRRYLNVLGEEVLRLNRSLTALLAQNPHPSEASQAFDLRVLLDELVALLGPQAKAQRVTIETALPNEAIPVVGRRDRLKQAFLNVAINALEAMPQGGVMRIAVERDETNVRLAIRDEGPGIPPEIVERIYAMHFTTKSGGTGIGLYVARSVVLAHHGTIRVESSPGAGTVVYVTLPLG